MRMNPSATQQEFARAAGSNLGDFDDALDHQPVALDPASGCQPAGGGPPPGTVDQHVLHPELRRRRLPIAEHGEVSKCRSITVADCRTSRFASTASHAAAE